MPFHSQLLNRMLRLCLVLILPLLLSVVSAPTISIAAPSTANPGPIPAGALARIGKGSIIEVVLSPNEKRLAVGTTIGLYMLDATTMKQLWYVQADNLDRGTLVFSPDSQRIAATRYGQVFAWNTQSGGLYRKYPFRNDLIQDLTYSSDNRYLIGNTGWSLIAWDAKTARRIYETSSAYEHGEQLAASPDSSMVAIDFGRTLELRDPAKGTLLRSFVIELPEDNYAPVTGIHFSPNSQYVAVAMRDGTLLMWNAKTGEWLYTKNIFNGEQRLINDFQFSPDGSQIAVGSKTVAIVDALTGNLVRTYSELPEPVLFEYEPYFSIQGGLRAFWSTNEGFEQKDVDTNQTLAASNAFPSAIIDGVITPDGKLLILSRYTGETEIWNVATQEKLNSFCCDLNRILAVSPDSKRFANIPYFSTVTIRDIASGQPLVSFNIRNTATPMDAGFTADGSTLVIAYDDGVIDSWSTSTAQLVNQVMPYPEPVVQMLFSPGARKVAVALTDKVQIWDMATNTHAATIAFIPGDTEFGSEFSWAFSPDGSRLVTGDFLSNAFVWNTQTGAKVRTIRPLQGWLSSAALSSDGRVAVGADHGVINVWSAGSGLRTRMGHGASVSSLNFIASNGRVISTSWDGTVVIWHKP